jgi:hypothetical protein
VEADRLGTLRAALGSGSLRTTTSDRTVPAFAAPAGAPDDTPAVLTTVAGRCVFYAGGCEVHRTLGHAALPLACRQFPRVSVIDPRGVSVTLSHYCPTAADMLLPSRPATILRSPPGFPSGGEYHGLDARASLPPMLRPELLMDWDSWWAWERLAVEFLGRGDDSPDAQLATLSAAVELIRGWTPDHREPLPAHVRASFAIARSAPASAARGGTEATRGARGGAEAARGARGPGATQPGHHELPAPLSAADAWHAILAAIPDDFRDAARANTDRAGRDAMPDDVLSRLLAAHAFASWTAHLGDGLRSWLRSLDAVRALARDGYTPGAIDLLLRHLADPRALAHTWSAAETLRRP